MGGAVALLVQGESTKDIFSAVVLVDITPDLERQGVTEIRNFMRKKMHEGFATLDEAADFIASYTKRPRREDLSGLEKNLRKGIPPVQSPGVICP